MRTTRGLGLAFAGLMVCALGGCGAEDAGEDDANLTSTKVTLKAPGDPGLSFVLEMFNGVKEKTKDQRFTKLVAKRGKKSFSLWCAVSGQVKGSAVTDKVDCSDYAETVSNDDDESLAVTFTRTQSGTGKAKYTVEYAYSGDGTVYGAELAILEGKADELPSGEIALESSGGGSINKDPFAMAKHVDGGLAPLIGDKVTPPGKSPTKVSSLSYDLSTKLEATLGFRLGNTGAITFDLETPVSILKTPGKPSSGVDSEEAILARVKEALAGAPTTLTVDAGVGELEEIFSPGGRHDEFGVSSSTPITMVHQYIEKKYEGDASEFKFVTDGDMTSDEQVAGTVKASAAHDAVVEAFDYWLADSLENPEEAPALREKAIKLIDGLADAGAAFGFDGWEQNGCAAPTSFLLVLDTKSKMVYGVDLNPCIE